MSEFENSGYATFKEMKSPRQHSYNSTSNLDMMSVKTGSLSQASKQARLFPYSQKVSRQHKHRGQPLQTPKLINKVFGVPRKSSEQAMKVSKSAMFRPLTQIETSMSQLNLPYKDPISGPCSRLVESQDGLKELSRTEQFSNLSKISMRYL